MAKFDSQLAEIISREARPAWDVIIRHNRRYHPERITDSETLIRNGFEDFTYQDFCDEIRLEIE